MIVVIEAPDESYCDGMEFIHENQFGYRQKNSSIFTSIFLAGGISSCPDWQGELIQKIKQYRFQKNYTFYNPRRKIFHDSNAVEIQIKWEYERLKKSDIIIFWFSEGGLNSIVLYELGLHGNSHNRKIIVGVHPDYERKQDVIIQTNLARPDINIVHSLDDIVKNLLIIDAK